MMVWIRIALLRLLAPIQHLLNSLFRFGMERGNIDQIIPRRLSDLIDEGLRVELGQRAIIPRARHTKGTGMQVSWATSSHQWDMVM